TIVLGGTWGNGFTADSVASVIADISGPVGANGLGIYGCPQSSTSRPPWRTFVRGTSLGFTSFEQCPILLGKDHTVYVDATNGYALIILTTPASSTATELRVKRVDSNSNSLVWIQVLGGGLMDGASLLTPAPNQGYVFQSDGVQWRITAK